MSLSLDIYMYKHMYMYGYMYMLLNRKNYFTVLNLIHHFLGGLKLSGCMARLLV